MEGLVHAFEAVFGRQDEITVVQMALRALVTYPLALAMIRLGDKRFLGEIAAFDFLLAIIIGSILSRAIAATAPYWPSLAACLALVLFHWLIARAGYRFDRLGTLVKGRSRTLVRDGEIQWDAMRRAAIGEKDLKSALRREGLAGSLDSVQLACLERNGEISVVTRPR